MDFWIVTWTDSNSQTHFSSAMARSLFVCLIGPLIFPMLASANMDMKKQMEELGALPFSDNPFFARLIGNSGKIIYTYFNFKNCIIGTKIIRWL